MLYVVSGLVVILFSVQNVHSRCSGVPMQVTVQMSLSVEHVLVKIVQ